MRCGWNLGADPNQVRGQSRIRIVANVAEAEFVINESNLCDESRLSRDFFIEIVKPRWHHGISN